MRFKKLIQVSQITAGQPAQAKLNVPGPTFDAIMLECGNTAGMALTDITNIKLVVDGNTVQEFATGAVLDALNQYHGRKAAGGAGTVASPRRLVIYLARPELTSFLGLGEANAERVTSLRTKDVGSAYVEFTIAGAGAFCNAFVEEAPIGAAEPSGFIVRVKRFPQNPVAGDNELFDQIPRGKGETSLLAIHMNKADITKSTLKENGYPAIDQLTTDALQFFQGAHGKVPQANWVTLDLLANGNLNEVLLLDKARDLRATVTITAAAAFDAYVEYLDKLGSGL